MPPTRRGLLALALAACCCGRAGAPGAAAPRAFAGPASSALAPVSASGPVLPVSTLALRRKFPSTGAAFVLPVRGGLVAFEGSTTTLYSLGDDFPLKQTLFASLFGGDVNDGEATEAGGLLFGRGAGGWLRAVDGASLRPRWQVALGRLPLVASPIGAIVEVGGVIVVHAELSPRVSRDSDSIEPRDLDGEAPRVPSGDTMLFGLSADDGRVLWSLALGPANEGVLAAGGGRVAFLGSDAFVTVLSPRDGRVTATARAQRFAPYSDTRVSISERYLTVAAVVPYPTVAVFDASTGAPVLERQLADGGSVDAAQAHGDTLLVSLTSADAHPFRSHIEAFELPSGRSRWRSQRQTVRSAGFGWIHRDPDAVLICGGGGLVSAHEPSSGALLWKWSFTACPLVHSVDPRAPVSLLVNDPGGTIDLYARGQPAPPPFSATLRGATFVNGVPTAGVVVEADGQSTRSGPRGIFSLPIGTPGHIPINTTFKGMPVVPQQEVFLGYPGASVDVELHL